MFPEQQHQFVYKVMSPSPPSPFPFFVDEVHVGTAGTLSNEKARLSVSFVLLCLDSWPFQFQLFDSLSSHFQRYWLLWETFTDILVKCNILATLEEKRNRKLRSSRVRTKLAYIFWLVFLTKADHLILNILIPLKNLHNYSIFEIHYRFYQVGRIVAKLIYSLL